jgi:hypothetical protein
MISLAGRRSVTRIIIEGASANDSTRTVSDTGRGSKEQPKAGFSGALRRLFRQAAKTLTVRDDAPALKKSRREDTGKRFTKAASRLTRLRAPAAVALPWLVDTLDWLNLWDCGGPEWTDDVSQGGPNNHLSPRL